MDSTQIWAMNSDHLKQEEICNNIFKPSSFTDKKTKAQRGYI